MNEHLLSGGLLRPPVLPHVGRILQRHVGRILQLKSGMRKHDPDMPDRTTRYGLHILMPSPAGEGARRMDCLRPEFFLGMRGK